MLMTQALCRLLGGMEPPPTPVARHAAGVVAVLAARHKLHRRPDPEDVLAVALDPARSLLGGDRSMTVSCCAQ